MCLNYLSLGCSAWVLYCVVSVLNYQAREVWLSNPQYDKKVFQNGLPLASSSFFIASNGLFDYFQQLICRFQLIRPTNSLLRLADIFKWLTDSYQQLTDSF